MKIKKVADKPILVHKKESPKLHTKSAPETKMKDRNIFTITRNSETKQESGNISASKKVNQKKDEFKQSVQKEGIAKLRYRGTKTENPITNAAETKKNTYRTKTLKQQSEKCIKKSNYAKKLMSKLAKGITAKKSRKVIKGAVRKAAKETVKTSAKLTIQTAGTVAGTTTRAGGFYTGAATGEIEIAERKTDRRDTKNFIKRRMIQLYISKLKQEDNQDSIGKVLKDIIMMRFAIITKYIVKYVAVSMLYLFMLAAFVTLPVIAVIATLYNSPFAIFLPSISSGDTVLNVLSAYAAEFNRDINTELNQHSGYDRSEKVYVNFEGYGIPDNYYDILAAYMVKHGNGDTATDMKKKAKENLKTIFDDMCSYQISSGKETITDEDGKKSTYTIKYINITLLTYQDMISQYAFQPEEVEMMKEIMCPQNLEMLGYTDASDNLGQKVISDEQYRAVVDAVSDANGKKVVDFVLSKIGYPYSQAQRDSGYYYDCSSLEYYAWKNAGVNIMYEDSNTAASEGKYCYDKKYLVEYEEMQAGDLIFYSYAKNGRFMNISHVAVYVGNDMVVEAVNEQLGIVYRPIQSQSSIVFIGRPRR